ncbi:hypothetical protein STEG23_020857, partial [Scotinomys teguina]
MALQDSLPPQMRLIIQDGKVALRTKDTAPTTDHSNDCIQVCLGKSMNVIGVSYKIMGIVCAFLKHKTPRIQSYGWFCSDSFPNHIP